MIKYIIEFVIDKDIAYISDNGFIYDRTNKILSQKEKDLLAMLLKTELTWFKTDKPIVMTSIPKSWEKCHKYYKEEK